jgi:8-oxo-dGTP diphosphatase
MTTEQALPWPRAGVSAAVFRGGSVLVVQRAKSPFQGQWSLPGGHIEAGETAREAILRELAEETGVTARIDGLAELVDAIDAPGGVVASHYLIAVFHGTWLSGEPVASSDAADARFVPLAEVAKLPATPGLAGVVQAAWILAKSTRDTP